MYTDSRDEEVKLLKRLWTSQPTVCPKCGGAELVHLHKKASVMNIYYIDRFSAKNITTNNGVLVWTRNSPTE